MSEWFGFIVTCLAAYRITRFITEDVMPFYRIREYLEERWSDTIYVDGLTCSWCMGAWVSAALVTGLAQITSIPLPGLYFLAVSTVVGVISRGVED